MVILCILCLLLLPIPFNCNKTNMLTQSGQVPPTVGVVSDKWISNPLGIWRYEMKTGITNNIGSLPRGVVITRKKPALVVLACTSPPLVRPNTVAGRSGEEHIISRTVFHLYCLKFVLISDERQFTSCFSYENSIKIETDNVGWFITEYGYQS